MSEHPAVLFLIAELARVEALAQAADSGPWKVVDGGYYGQPLVQIGVDPGNHWERAYEFNGDAAWRCDDPDDTCADVRGYERAEAQLIASQADPAAVLRRVAADRQVLAEHAHGGMAEERDETECRVCSGPSPGFSGSWPIEWPCRTVLLLAQAWGWAEATT